jgi:hypothetical protein
MSSPSRLESVRIFDLKAMADSRHSQREVVQLRFITVFEVEGFSLIEGLLAHIHIPSDSSLFLRHLAEQDRRGCTLRISAN